MSQKKRNMRYSTAIPLFALVILGVIIYIAIISFGPNVLNAVGLTQTAVTPTPIPIPTLIPTPTPTPIPTPTPTPTLTPLQTVQAQSAYVIDSDTNTVLANINSAQVLPIASVTKIMTALVAIQYGNLNSLIPIQQDAADRVALDGASGALLVVGDRISLQDLLYGLLLRSGSDAAVAIADYEGGTDLFVQHMNDMAASLQLYNTHFVNVDGLTEDNGQQNVSTVVDLVKLGQAAMQNSLIASIVALPSYTVPPTINHHSYPWTNIDPLLGVYPGLIGVKTGYTEIAGYCMVFAAKRSGHYLIGAVLNSPTEAQRDQDITTLLNLSFTAEGVA